MAIKGFSKVGRAHLDGRKRIGLGKVKKQFEDYEVHEAPDGRVMLVPMTLVPACEAWLHENQEALQSVKRGLRQSAKGEVVRKPGLAKYSSDDID